VVRLLGTRGGGGVLAGGQGPRTRAA
jgi:hypothetical protein